MMEEVDITKEILPSELDSLFDTLEYENYGIFKTDKVSFEKNLIEFCFTIKITEGLFEEGEQNYRWKLKIKNCIDYHIEDSKKTESFITVFSDHILLSPYKKVWKELYFKGSGKNTEQLFIEFYDLHIHTLHGFILPEKYLANRNISKLLGCEGALFARGPEDILDLYFDLLLKFEKKPYYFQNTKKIEEKTESNLKIVFLGNNYFIGEQLEFEKL